MEVYGTKQLERRKFTDAQLNFRLHSAIAMLLLLLFGLALLSPSRLLAMGDFAFVDGVMLRSDSSGRLRFLSRPDGDMDAAAVAIAVAAGCFDPGGMRGPARVPAIGEPVVVALRRGNSG